jgi:hypothetical protein
MALARTTLSAAVAAADTSIVVASATGFAAGNPVRVDAELLKVTKGYVAGNTTVPVLRGQDGTAVVAHAKTAGVIVGTAAEFATPAPQTTVTYPLAGRARTIINVSVTSTLTLPAAGTDLLVVLNGTTVIALTVPVPTKDMDGTVLWIASDGAAAHTVTFTGGLSGASTSYDVVTVNATAPVLLGPIMAVNSLWQMAVAVPLAGTVTNLTATVA